MSDILITYDERKDKFESYALTLKSLLTTLIRNEKISIHSLESRVKTKKSLEGKINKKGKYKSIDDITDIVGIRIITHYADDVDKIAAIVEKEFTIDQENSIDKRTSIAPDKFGYLSLHYIVTLNSTRTNLKEYEVYKNIKAELQIRSILQHAWAEIEHDIGYKSATGLPNEIRRYFSRLAGLLEMADDEFIKIRKKISERQKEVAKELEQGTSDSVLDIFTLDEFLNT
ncbi:TPA: GTP pyrophosphokinase family protein, partial [Escherichia coli]